MKQYTSTIFNAPAVFPSKGTCPAVCSVPCNSTSTHSCFPSRTRGIIIFSGYGCHDEFNGGFGYLPSSCTCTRRRHENASWQFRALPSSLLLALVLLGPFFAYFPATLWLWWVVVVVVDMWWCCWCCCWRRENGKPALPANTELVGDGAPMNHTLFFRHP